MYQVSNSLHTLGWLERKNSIIIIPNVLRTSTVDDGHMKWVPPDQISITHWDTPRWGKEIIKSATIVHNVCPHHDTRLAGMDFDQTTPPMPATQADLINCWDMWNPILSVDTYFFTPCWTIDPPQIVSTTHFFFLLSQIPPTNLLVG